MRVPFVVALAGVLDFFAFILISVTYGGAIAVLACVGAPFIVGLLVGLLFSPGVLRLEDSEKVIAQAHPSGPVVWIAYVLSLGLYAYWRAAEQLTITDRRVVYQKGLVTKTERSLPLHFVQDATVRTVVWSSHVTLSTAGGAEGVGSFGPCWLGDARALKDLIVDSARQSRQHEQLTPAADGVVVALQSLQDLHVAGALTGDEFTAAKGRLLQS
jgi:hypothetical protein